MKDDQVPPQDVSLWLPETTYLKAIRAAELQGISLIEFVQNAIMEKIADLNLSSVNRPEIPPNIH